MDVVDPGNLAAWDNDPFTMTEKDGKLFGRGITDMKAGLAALVIAMIELKKQGLPKKGTIRLLATAGEEVGEEGSAAFYRDHYMEDAAGLLIAEPSTVLLLNKKVLSILNLPLKVLPFIALLLKKDTTL